MKRVVSNKKGLSPIIATLLLVSMTIILFVIIFIWAKSFVGEKAQKFDQPIESSCGDINFNAEYYGGQIHLVNRGNVPLYGIQIKENSLGSVEEKETFEGSTIASGETGVLGESLVLNSNTDYTLVPIILGKSGTNTKAFTCDDSFGVTITA